MTDWLSLGAGPAILYTTHTQRVKALALPGEPTLEIDDADSWDAGGAFSNIPIQVGPLGATQKRGWRDTWRIAAGVQFTPSETWTLQGGFGYDSSPVKSSRLLPDIQTSEQYRFSAGIQLRPKDYLEISASYQFLWFAGLDFDRVALPPSGAVVLDGDYDPAWANQVGVSLRVRF